MQQRRWQFCLVNLMKPETIISFINRNFDHVFPKQSWGETSFFVNPERKLPSGTYFATLKEKDGANDQSSNLNREGIFRLSVGPEKEVFKTLFGEPPARPPKGGIIQGPWDFSQKNVVMPHPIYGWMCWICVLNPTKEVFSDIDHLLTSAYEKALNSAYKRLDKSS